MANQEKQQQNLPFLLYPAGKDYLWGGRRLKDDFSKNLDLEPPAETWECSTHPDGLSMVSFGKDGDLSLHDVLLKHPEYLGTHPVKSMPEAAADGRIPILVKFIDAAKDLSVQVHPTDEYARIHEHGQLGKTEMWYVVDAGKDASLIYGFNRDMDRETVKRAALSGTLQKYLQKVPVEKDDVFLIRSGTVHAIGAGSLVVEVQESSNLTYRIYDYDRTDKNGKKRALHLEKALDVMDYQALPAPRQPMRKLTYRPGAASEFLCRCKYFEVRRMLLNTQRIHTMASYRTDSTSFHVLICIDGCGVLFCMNNQCIPFFRGDTVFVPADSGEIRIHGIATLLDVNC